MSRGFIGILGDAPPVARVAAALQAEGFVVVSPPQDSDVVLTRDWLAAASRGRPFIALVDAAQKVAAFGSGAEDVWPLAIAPSVAAVRLDRVLQRRADDASRARQGAVANALLAGSSDGLWAYRPSTGELTLSPSARRTLGLSHRPDALTAWLDRVHPDDRAAVAHLFTPIADREPATDPVEHRTLVDVDSWRWLSVHARCQPTGHDGYLSGTLVDVTSERGTDRTTGLPNAERFNEALGIAMERARRRDGTVLGVARVRLDGLGHLSGALGPPWAEPLLRQAAAALSSCVRAVDTVARIGESEFAVLLEHVASPRNALLVARRMLMALDFHIEVLAGVPPPTPIIGLATTGPGYSSAAELLEEAATAVARARAQGSGIEFFDHVEHGRTIERLELEGDLAQAIGDARLTLCYQPIINLSTGALSGFEALVRWRCPRRGVISPSSFIPIAEDTGLIRPLGLWVMRTAVEQACAWRATAGLSAAGTMSVNVSPRQLEDDTFVSAVAQLLAETGFPAAELELELTESVLMDDRTTSISRLAALRGIGLQVAIDDFGTGHSTLGYLHQLPATKLKIDQSFVRPIEPASGRPDFVRSLVLLAHDAGLVVVAEGIETRADHDRLAALGCDLGQGYYFAEPLTAEEATLFLERWRGGGAPTTLG